MTLKELYGIRELDKEISDITAKIKELQENATNTAAKLNGMPSSGAVGDKVGTGATEIAYYTEFLENAKARKVARSQQIHEYIERADDSITRRIMYLRFIKRNTWRQIAIDIGGGNTEDSVRKRCNRYVYKNMR